MRLLFVAFTVFSLAMATFTPVYAGTASGTTELLDPPVSGEYVDVDVSVLSEAPVVAYLYSLQNKCYFSGNANGKADSLEEFSIANWNYSEPPPNGAAPHAVETINLLPVPSGATCKVSLVNNNTTVKGSTTVFTVE